MSTPSPRLLNFLTSAKEGNPARSLLQADAAFDRLKSPVNPSQNSPPFVQSTHSQIVVQSDTHFDVVIVGATLGVFHAAALQKLGHRVLLIERGQLRGRTQEWNISRQELSALISNNVLTPDQLEQCIITECKRPSRISFASRTNTQRSLSVSDVLNIGVSPARLVAIAAQNFVNAGGTIFDQTALRSVTVAPNAVSILLQKQPKQQTPGALGAGGTGMLEKAPETAEQFEITSRVLLDCMGSFSPIASQARNGRKPDGVCITVGSCMRGAWPENDVSDLIYSFQPINASRSAQYFWEAFPAGENGDCRTTYMFSYGPCDARRQSLTDALEDYLDALPEYQGVDVNDMQVERILFGFFPSYYRSSPTDVAFDRILPIGDAGGLQSPISFGGFGCCLRHLERITTALDEALSTGDDALLMKDDLQTLQWYLPSLSVTGLFNRAMSVQPGQKTAGPLLDEYGINEVLWSNMKAMDALGDEIQRPFLQDVITANGLSQTLLAMAVSNPLLALKMVPFLGPGELLSWSRHFFALLSYAAAYPLVRSIRNVAKENSIGDSRFLFRLNRLVDAAKFGSGADVTEHLE